MQSGTHLSWYRYQLESRLTDFSVDRGGTTSGLTAIAAGSAVSQYTLDQSTALQTFAFAACRIEQASDGTYTRTWSYKVGLSTGSTSSGGSGDMTSMLEFQDLKVSLVFFLGSYVFLASWSNVDWYVDGSLHTSLGPGSQHGTHFAPSGVPLLGIPASVQCSCAVDPTISSGTVDELWHAVDSQSQAPAYERALKTIEDSASAFEAPLSDAIIAPYRLGAEKQSYDDPGGDYHVQATASCSGGWRFKAESGGAWIAPAVTVEAVGSPIGSPGPCTCAPGFPSVSGTTTFDLATDGYYRVQRSSDRASYETRGSTLWGFPAWQKSLSKMNGGYRAVVERFPMPGAKHEQQATCGTSDGSPNVCDVALANFFPRKDSYLSGRAFGDLEHGTEDVASYANFTCSPLWSFLLYFPQDNTTGTLDSRDWTIDGATVLPSEYWIPIREQWAHYPYFPTRADESLKRNSIVTEPLKSGQLSGLIAGYFGQETSWWGVSRFEKAAYTVPATYQYTSASSSLWSATDAGLTHGADVLVDLDPGKTSCTVRLLLHSFSVEPFMLPQLAQKFAVQWSNGSANVASVSVYLENPHGDTVLLTTASGATPVARPDSAQDDSKYAGSWAQDFGAGTVSDTGTDSQAEGESIDVLAAEERVDAFQLLAGYGAKWLKFVVTVDAAGGTMHLAYPELTLPADPAAVCHENSNWAVLANKDGPGLRHTQLYWFDGTDLHTDPPLISPYGQDPFPVGAFKPSALDCLAYIANFLEGAEVNATGLETAMALYFDSDEGTTVGDLDADTVCLLASDPDGAALEGLHLMVNSWRETPPCVGLPVPARDSVYDRDLTAWGLFSYSLCKGPRDVVARQGSGLEVIDPDDSSVWTSPVALTSGWEALRHDHAVDGYEHATFLLKGSQEFAQLSPWHGYFALTPSEAVLRNPWNFHLEYDHYHRAGVLNGDIQYRQADKGYPPFDQSVDAFTTGKDSYPRMAVDPLTQRMHLVWIREDPPGTFGCYLATSDDEGRTWSSEEVTISDGRFPTVACSRDGTVVIMAFKYDSGTSGPGTVYQRVRKMGDADFSAEAQVKDSGGTPIAFAEDTFHVSQAFDAQHTWILAARPSGSGDVREYLSYDDCQTFQIV